MNIKQCEEELTKIKTRMMMSGDLVFFSNVFFNLKMSWTDEHPTACTDGLFVKFNPEFFMGLRNRDERLFLVLHEIYHVAFQHMFRVGDRDFSLWIKACDYVVNSMLIDQGYSMPACGLYDPQFKGMSVEDVYDILAQQQQNNPDQGGNQQQGQGQGEGFGDDFQEPNSEGNGDTQEGNGRPSREQLEATQKQIENMLVKSALQAQLTSPDNSVGNIPAEMQIILDKLMNPKVPWNKLLRRYYFASAKTDFTFRKPNRRFMPKHYLPSLHGDGLSQIGVAVDASSSVDKDTEFPQFVAETRSILSREKPEVIKFVQFNTNIISDDRIKSVNELKKMEFRGYGGTDIDPVIEWTKKNKPDVMIIFTDGQFYLHENDPKVPIIWIIYNNPNFEVPYGKVVHYEL